MSTKWRVRSEVLEEDSSVEKLKALGSLSFYYLSKVSVYEATKYESETIGSDAKMHFMGKVHFGDFIDEHVTDMTKLSKRFKNFQATRIKNLFVKNEAEVYDSVFSLGIFGQQTYTFFTSELGSLLSNLSQLLLMLLSQLCRIL